jgi:hypothetical protein
MTMMDFTRSILLYIYTHTHTHKEVLNFLGRFAAAGASLAESRARVLPMNQSSDGLQS